MDAEVVKATTEWPSVIVIFQWSGCTVCVVAQSADDKYWGSQLVGSDDDESVFVLNFLDKLAEIGQDDCVEIRFIDRGDYRW